MKKIKLILLVVLTTLVLECFAYNFNGENPPFFIEKDELIELENSLDLTAIDFQNIVPYMRLIEFYLNYKIDNKSTEKALNIFDSIIKNRQELDLKFIFSRYVYSLKKTSYNLIANKYLLELASLGYSPAIKILLDGCNDSFFSKCEVSLSNFASRLIVSFDYKNNNSNFICNTNYEKNINIENIALIEALNKMSLLNHGVPCTTSKGLVSIDPLKNKIFHKVNILTYPSNVYINSLVDYLKNIKSNPSYLEKIYFYKYCKV